MLRVCVAAEHVAIFSLIATIPTKATQFRRRLGSPRI
jgi:hypothetical protein